LESGEIHALRESNIVSMKFRYRTMVRKLGAKIQIKKRVCVERREPEKKHRKRKKQESGNVIGRRGKPADGAEGIDR